MLSLSVIILGLSLISPALSQVDSHDYDHDHDPSPPVPDQQAILLSSVQTLTLRANRLTTSRRLPPIPQLKCTGPSNRICNLYPIESMRCTNAGYDHNHEDIQWTCTTQLPPEFKLGSTDVVCEGYSSGSGSDDAVVDKSAVLRGSCGVEYRLLLTDRGEERFGYLRERDDFGSKLSQYASRNGVMALVGNLVFFGFVAFCFIFILFPMVGDCFGLWRRGPRGPNEGRAGGGGGGGGGDGGDDGYPPGSPPPYTSEDPSQMSSPSSAQSQGWRPGFMTGTLGGAALGHGLGRNNNHNARPPTASGRRTSVQRNNNGHDHDHNPGGYDPGEGSSRFASSPAFSSTTAATGFGSTRRR